MSFSGSSYANKPQYAPQAQYGSQMQPAFQNNSMNMQQPQMQMQQPQMPVQQPQMQMSMPMQMPQMQQQQSFSSNQSFGEQPPPYNPTQQSTSLTLPPANSFAPDKQVSTMLMADQQTMAAMQGGGMANVGRSKEDRMYDATVKELASEFCATVTFHNVVEIIEVKYKAQLVHKRGASENIAYLIHRHCEALRMLGHVADEIIKHTNLMLQDARLDLDTIFSKTGGDYWCLKEATDFVRSLVVVFQKEAVTLHFPHYLQQQQYLAEMQSQQEEQSQQNTYAQQQQQQQAAQQQQQMAQYEAQQRRRPPKKSNDDCCIS